VPEPGVELERVEQGAVGGEEHDPLRLSGERGASSSRRRLGVTVVLALLEDGVPEPARVPGDCLIGGHDQGVVDRASAADLAEEVVEHRLGEATALVGVEHTGEPRVRGPESLDRQDCGRLQGF
jgi:hypothetical protein